MLPAQNLSAENVGCVIVEGSLSAWWKRFEITEGHFVGNFTRKTIQSKKNILIMEYHWISLSIIGSLYDSICMYTYMCIEHPVQWSPITIFEGPPKTWWNASDIIGSLTYKQRWRLDPWIFRDWTVGNHLNSHAPVWDVYLHLPSKFPKCRP